MKKFIHNSHFMYESCAAESALAERVSPESCSYFIHSEVMEGYAWRREMKRIRVKIKWLRLAVSSAGA